MKKIVNIMILTFGMIFILQGTAYAGSCASVKREMAYGQAATEDAKDKAGFKRAAGEFNKAAQKASNCAAAFFNLGLVQEKAGELVAAKAAYEQYLKLAPNALDADSVEQQIFKLEYQIQAAASPWNGIEGTWRREGSTHFPIYDLLINNDRITIRSKEHYFTTPNGCRIGSNEEYSGTISSDGTIQGTLKRGERRFEERCFVDLGPPGQWNFKPTPFTGKLYNNSRIHIQWFEYDGDREEFNLRKD